VNAGRRVRILIVEDDYLLAEELRSTIGEWGYEIVGVTGRGGDALQLALEARPDVLISDIRLSDALDGVTVAEEVNRRTGAKVIFITAFPAEAYASGRDWGAKFLGKPYSDRELRAVIEETLGDRSEADRQP